VGKSTLINQLAGEEVMKTGEISEFSHRGRHVTSHRELILLPGGSIVIDNPGMREIGLTDVSDGIEASFCIIDELGAKCFFSDCSHIHEKKCAVLAAVENGELDRGLYENFLKLKKENEWYGSSAAVRHKKDRIFGRIQKNFNKKKKGKRS